MRVLGLHFRLAGLLLMISWCLPGAAQILGIAQQTNSSPQNAPSAPKDPRGRGTPQSAVLNFVRYAQRGDYETAAKYLQLSTPKQNQQGEELARELLTLINTSLHGSIGILSNEPEGSRTDSDEPNLEVAGRFVVEKQEVPFLLARVYREDTGSIWLVSSQTLEQIPGLYQQVGTPELDRYFPGFLKETTFLGVPAGQWLTWLLSIPFSWLLAWGVVRVSQRIWRRRRTTLESRESQNEIALPVDLMLAMLVNGVLVFFVIGMPVFYRVYYFRVLAMLFVICAAWLAVRISDLLYEHAKARSLGSESRSILQLLYRSSHVVILIVTILLCLSMLGFDTKTMLAGLGIGGIALALAAQKTLENLIGGVTLVMDKAASVGDICIISNRTVTVREIGLRSILATTLEGSEITFPNGMLAQANIENLSRQSRFLIAATLSLSHECSLAQLQCLVARVRDLLYSHARVFPETARFRLSGVTGVAYQIELFAYVKSSNGAEFAAVREDVLFRIVEIIESAGATWAIPAQTTYLSQEALVDEKKVAEAEETVRKWQSSNEIPFPDFSPAHIAEVRGTIAYPPDRSVLRQSPAPIRGPLKDVV